VKSDEKTFLSNYYFSFKGLSKTKIFVHVYNIPSIKIYQKNKLKEEKSNNYSTNITIVQTYIQP
jgi:hypothetical protein